MAKNKAVNPINLSQPFWQICHEIRTPMNAIVGFTTAKGCKPFNDERDQYIEIVNSNCNSLLMLIDDILDISMIRS
jgi:signal transduction histidine kinase